MSRSRTTPNETTTANAATNKRAAIYVRVSGESDSRTASLSTQTDACKALALQNGFVVDDADIFVERFSGRYLRERAELEKLRALVDDGTYGAVVFYQLDRFSRGGAKHLWVLLPQFRDRGITLLSVKDDLTDTPINNITLTIKAELASQEIEHIRDRVQRGLQEKVESGKHPGNGGNLYGYRMDKETWKREVFEPEAETIREIFTDASNGISTKKIAANLTTKGITSPGESLGRKKASQKWFSAGIARIIRNRSYIGETTVNRSDKEIELGEVTPPIVSVELFDQANYALDNKLGRIQSRNEQSFVMLRGMIFCMRCGSRCYPKSDGRGYISFFCSSQDPERHKNNCGAPSLSVNWLNHWVWSSLAQHLRSKESCEEMIEDLKKEQTDLNPLYRDRERLENRIREIETESQRLVRALARTDDDKVIAVIEREIKTLTKQREDVDDFLNALSVEIKQRESEQIDIPSLLELQLQFQYGYSVDWSDQQKRDYLLNWGFSIFIDGRRFEIRMRSGKLLRSFDESAALIARKNAPGSLETISKKLLRPETQRSLSPELRRLLALDDPLNDELSAVFSGRSGFLK
jgi:DNA invertase Pin-like site-specific DNA recombinase